ncbi:MAG TPA: chemotaxis protein CheW [Clostridiales bacterium]|nr:chemotaxis protein CheW [Clostridiales bacterium]
MREFQVLLYTVNGDIFGTYADEVVEIIDSKGLADGFITVRDVRVPVIKLGTFLGKGDTTVSTDSKVILVNQNGHYVGFLVDSVTELIRLQENSVHNAPEILKTPENRFIVKFGIAGEQPFPIIKLSYIDVERVY